MLKFLFELLTLEILEQSFLLGNIFLFISTFLISIGFPSSKSSRTFNSFKAPNFVHKK